MTTRILVVDNYDSFVWTIAGYLAQLGADCDVLRNDAVTTAEADGYDGVLLSPGPGVPAEAGVSPDMVRHCAGTGTPLLGVCLGHQALGEVFGGTVAHAPDLRRGSPRPRRAPPRTDARQDEPGRARRHRGPLGVALAVHGHALPL